MKVKCDYCDNYFDENLANCPDCGAANSHIKRTSNEVPKTIEELQAWYKARNLPDEEVTRFFIGKDYKGAKAFGIYQDGEEFIVYKNKDNGQRAVRYQGKDEAYAVNELYMKLKETVAWQKENNRNKRGGRKNSKSKFNLKESLFSAGVVAAIIAFSFVIASTTPGYGYYKYNNNLYYYHSDWYVYDDYDGWSPTTDIPSELHDNYDDYYESSYYTSDMDAEDITQTSWADSWDDDSDWDSNDSWDSDGGTDWGSDW